MQKEPHPEPDHHEPLVETKPFAYYSEAVEIETMRAQAEVQPLLRLAEELSELKGGGKGALAAYLRKIELDLIPRAKRIIGEVRS